MQVLSLLLLLTCVTSMESKTIESEDIILSSVEATSPRLFSLLDNSEMDYKEHPHSQAALLHLPLLSSRQDFWFHLTPTHAASFPVTVMGDRGSVRQFNHSSRCTYLAWLLPHAGEGKFGVVTACGDGIEGHLPLNESHLVQVSPTLRLLRPRRRRSSSVSAHRMLVMLKVPSHVDWRVRRRRRRESERMRRSHLPDIVSDFSFWRRMDAAFVTLRRRRRNLWVNRLRVNTVNNVFTRKGPFVVELSLLVDSKFHEKIGSSESTTINYAQRFVSNINAIYATFNTIFVIKKLLIHSTAVSGYDFAATNQIESALTMFKKYSNTNSFNSDCAHLLTGLYNPQSSTVGLAKLGVMCFATECYGTTTYNASPTFVAHTASHEIGHNFGLDHVPDSDYLMYGFNTGHSKFHEFSKRWMRVFLSMDLPHCLVTPRPEITEWGSTSSWPAVCGNSIIEGDEECDCGGSLACSQSFGDCCDSKTCKLKPQAECGGGRCCDTGTCKFKSAGTECREARNDCDLPEYCSGKSSYCPPDYTVRNGERCGDDRCYEGYCGSRERTCRAVFGEQSIIYPHLSTTCLELYCSAEMEIVQRARQVSSVANYAPRNLGFTRIYKMGSTPFYSSESKGYEFFSKVPNGAKCRDGKMCLNKNCVTPDSVLKKTPAKADCHGNGVVNNRGNCHCNQGFAPPLCKTPGKGGSIDSQSAECDFCHKKNYLIIVGFVVLGLLAAAAIAAGAFVLIKSGKMKPLLETVKQKLANLKMPKTNAKGKTPQKKKVEKSKKKDEKPKKKDEKSKKKDEKPKKKDEKSNKKATKPQAKGQKQAKAGKRKK